MVAKGAVLAPDVDPDKLSVKCTPSPELMQKRLDSKNEQIAELERKLAAATAAAGAGAPVPAPAPVAAAGADVELVGQPADEVSPPRLFRRSALAMSSTSAPTANPLAIRDGLPKYSKIAATHVVPAITEALADLDSGLSTIEADLAATPSSFADVVEPLEKLRFPLEYSWGVVGHLNGVKNSDELRAAHAEMQPQVVQAMMKMTQSKPVYDAFAALEKDAAKLTPAEARIVEASVRDMRNGGVALEGAAKERYVEKHVDKHGPAAALLLLLPTAPPLLLPAIAPLLTLLRLLRLCYYYSHYELTPFASQVR